MELYRVFYACAKEGSLTRAADKLHVTQPAISHSITIKIKVTNRTTPESIALLKDGSIDFALVNLPLTDPQLEVKKVFEVHDCFFAGPRFEHVRGQRLSLDEILSLPLILLEEGSNSRQYLNQFMQQKEYTLEPEIELGSLDLLVEFARIGLGVSCLTREFVDLEGSTLFEIDLAERIPPREIGIVKLKNVPLSEAASAFVHSFFFKGNE
ncbi:LysR family transcriptional regulator [uncultured Brevibacillus sp.]|uniref:LysR family transcriptional regulator n=1 Tax=uncultured Brevibacillus sp. TaxID=169970 RepID=UPI002593DF60|nr:LysR family transcriptional regulator [uncultured Brevibacillus sp.]